MVVMSHDVQSYRYCFQTYSPFLMTSYFVETALTANHCGCQIFQEQTFSSKHALDASINLAFIFINYFVSLLFLFHSCLAQFSHKSRIVSCIFLLLQDPWTAFMLKMLMSLFTSSTGKEGFIAFLNISEWQVKKCKTLLLSMVFSGNRFCVVCPGIFKGLMLTSKECTS